MCHGNHFVLHSLGVFLMLVSKYELDIRPPSTELLQFLTLTLKSCHVMPLGCSIRVPSFNWIRLIVSELGRLQFSIYRQLKVLIFTKTNVLLCCINENEGPFILTLKSSRCMGHMAHLKKSRWALL